MNRSRQRKIVYLVTIVVLFTLMIFVGNHLQRLQERQGLAQKSLGDVNPTGHAFGLVLGGFKGVAVLSLWTKAQELQKTKRFFEIEPVVHSIRMLMPHFVEPYEFQAWNLAYNIPADWEAVADKYAWIKKGINYMKQAVRDNARNGDLEWYVGNMYFQRIGSSDEQKYFRQLFRKDAETDPEFVLVEDDVPEAADIVDSFQTARYWHERANQSSIEAFLEYGRRPVEKRERDDSDGRPKRMATHLFMCQPALCRTKYAEYRMKEPRFDKFGKFIESIDRVSYRTAWKLAYDEWGRFGNPPRGNNVGGLDRGKVLLFTIDVPPEERDQITPEQAYWRNRYERMVRYNYWRLRCREEGTPEMQSARQSIAEADRLVEEEGDYQRALELYGYQPSWFDDFLVGGSRTGIQQWRNILERNPTFREDLDFQDLCQEIEDRYLSLLVKAGEPTPRRRPFDGLVDPSDEMLFDKLRTAAQAELEMPVDEPPKAPSPGEPDSTSNPEPPKAPTAPQEP